MVHPKCLNPTHDSIYSTVIMDQIRQFMLCALAGWVNREQQEIIEYLIEENQTWRELYGKKRPRLKTSNAGVWRPKGSGWGEKCFRRSVAWLPPTPCFAGTSG